MLRMGSGADQTFPALVAVAVRQKRACGVGIDRIQKLNSLDWQRSIRRQLQYGDTIISGQHEFRNGSGWECEVSLEVLVDPDWPRDSELRRERIRLVVFKDHSAVVECPNHEPEHLLVADLDMATSPHPSGDGGEQFLDGSLLVSRLHQRPRRSFTQLPQEVLVRILDLRKHPMNLDLDVEFLKVRKSPCHWRWLVASSRLGRCEFPASGRRMASAKAWRDR